MSRKDVDAFADPVDVSECSWAVKHLATANSLAGSAACECPASRGGDPGRLRRYPGASRVSLAPGPTAETDLHSAGQRARTVVGLPLWLWWAASGGVCRSVWGKTTLPGGARFGSIWPVRCGAWIYPGDKEVGLWNREAHCPGWVHY